jgi:hypothetical protein
MLCSARKAGYPVLLPQFHRGEPSGLCSCKKTTLSGVPSSAHRCRFDIEQSHFRHLATKTNMYRSSYAIFGKLSYDGRTPESPYVAPNYNLGQNAVPTCTRGSRLGTVFYGAVAQEASATRRHCAHVHFPAPSSRVVLFTIAITTIGYLVIPIRAAV